MPNPPPSLAKLQQWMQAVITHPEGIAAGIGSSDARSHVPVQSAEIESVVLPSKALTSQERLAIYGNAYYGRLLECMREMFPALRYTLDDDVYDQFAMGYLTSHPPHSYTLEQLTDRFISFLENTRTQIADPEETWPDFVIDLARLEWNIERVFDGPGVEHSKLLSADDLQQIDPSRWPQATLVPAPCLRLLAFRFPVNDYFTDWRSLDSEQNIPLPLPDPSNTYLALTRRKFIVRRYALEQTQFDLLSALIEGLSVGEAIEAAAQSCNNLDHFAASLGNWFQDWTAAEFFVSVEL